MQLDTLCADIRAAHRECRFAMKQQSRIDRSLEAFIRVNVFGFSTMDDEKTRAKKSKAAVDLVKQCRKGEAAPEYASVAMMVMASDQSREAWDKIRNERTRTMARLAKELPAAAFVDGVTGFGLVGFAQIVGECGNLSNYANPGKVWKRMGLAPYDGLAMSSWRRTTWRPRTLTSEEWIDNPFNAERYAIVAQIATWLVNAQMIGAEKSGTRYGQPKGPYGEYYLHRREHTAQTHPDWTDMHARLDALRYTIKKLIRDLWSEWRKANALVEPTTDPTSAPLADAA